MSQYQAGCENFWNEAVLLRAHVPGQREGRKYTSLSINSHSTRAVVVFNTAITIVVIMVIELSGGSWFLP